LSGIALHLFCSCYIFDILSIPQQTTPSSMADSFAELRAAAIDGRTHNIYYRQHQLEALHTALINHASEIRDAIAADYDHSPAEVAIEIHLALSALKQSYETLQPTKAHADEYLLASGSDAPDAKIPAGIAYIEPCTHTLFFSVIAPLSAAIAAGSCAIVLVSADLDPTGKKDNANTTPAREQPPNSHTCLARYSQDCLAPRHIRHCLLAHSRHSHPQLSSPH
jgi:hypothetical protein